QSVHVLVYDRQGSLFLQKRSMRKDIQPGKWDTSVGGHFQPGESPEAAARREMTEELGVSPEHLNFVRQYLWRSKVETELVRTFKTLHEGPFKLDPSEIDEGRFWPLPEIQDALGRGIFTPNFEYELTL
ncbi:MAG: NUDIX domain-containing protein, partial [Lentisphaerota bacterium]